MYKKMLFKKKFINMIFQSISSTDSLTFALTEGLMVVRAVKVAQL